MKIVITLFTSFLILNGCSNAPNDKIIKQSIIECIQKNVPPSWAGSLLGGTDAKVEQIDIQQIGSYNETGKYWPVKARVRGTCQANLLVRKELKYFDKVGEFRIYKDDYGEYKATFIGH